MIKLNIVIEHRLLLPQTTFTVKRSLKSRTRNSPTPLQNIEGELAFPLVRARDFQLRKYVIKGKEGKPRRAGREGDSTGKARTQSH